MIGKIISYLKDNFSATKYFFTKKYQDMSDKFALRIIVREMVKEGLMNEMILDARQWKGTSDKVLSSITLWVADKFFSGVGVRKIIHDEIRKG